MNAKRVVTFGEIMLRLKTPDYLRFSHASPFEASYGGGEANVAVALAGFGTESEYVTASPDSDLGHAARMTLRKHGVGTEHIQFGGERLGIHFLEGGAVHRGSKVVYDRADSAVSNVEPGRFHWTGSTGSVSRRRSRPGLPRFALKRSAPRVRPD